MLFRSEYAFDGGQLGSRKLLDSGQASGSAGRADDGSVFEGVVGISGELSVGGYSFPGDAAESSGGL